MGLRKSDINAIRNEIKGTNWSDLFRNKSIDEMVDAFTNKLLLVTERHIPSKSITVNDKDCPWISSDVKAAINRNKSL